jgi:hypothetical protein
MGQYDLTMTLSQPCRTFGFELEPNPYLDYEYRVDFILMSGPTTIGNITMTVNGYHGARLFAVEADGVSFDRIVIDGDMEFAIAQVRYAMRGIQITTPSEGDPFWITNQTVSGKVVPVMPTIKCQARLFGFPVEPSFFTKYSWEAHVEYLYYLYVGKNKGDYTYSAATQTGTYVGAGNGNCIQAPCYKSDPISGQSVGSEFWIPSFRSEIIGGVLKIKVKATVFISEYSDEITVLIRGENPSAPAIRDRLDNPLYQVLCYQESSPKWHQFYPRSDSIKGLPVCASDLGYGLMQITDPPPTVPQIWDWRENVDVGKNRLIEKKDYAKSHIKRLISNMTLTDAEEAAKMKKSFPNDGYNREAYYLYRGGVHYYWAWDSVNHTWIIDPLADSDSVAYAQNAMSILAGIIANPPSFPGDWIGDNLISSVQI